MGENKTLQDLFESGVAPTNGLSLPLDGIFAVTIKCVKQGYMATVEDLERVYREMLHKFNGCSLESVIEQDSINRNHLHGTFSAKKTLRYTSFKAKYYHIFIKRLYKPSDFKRWSDYIHLDQEIQMKSFLKDIQKEYLFIDKNNNNNI